MFIDRKMNKKDPADDDDDRYATPNFRGSRGKFYHLCNKTYHSNCFNFH